MKGKVARKLILDYKPSRPKAFWAFDTIQLDVNDRSATYFLASG